MMKRIIRVLMLMLIVCSVTFLGKDVFMKDLIPVISNQYEDEIEVLASPTATPASTPVVTISPTAVVTQSPSPTPTATPKPTATTSPTPKPTATPTPKPTATIAPTPTSTPKPVATVEPTQTPEVTKEPTSNETKKIAFTFDDGPSKYTTQVMDAIESYGGHATFFVLGSRVEQYSSVILDMYQRGHEIENHSWSHANLKTSDKETIIYEIESTQNAIYNITGEYPTYLRPPYGATDDLVKEVASEYNLKLKLWTIDTLDWKSKNAEAIKNEILAQAKDGSVILLHDLYKTSLEGAILAMEELDKQGYEFVTISEL